MTHIAVDLDDVCMEFWSSILKCVEKEYGVHYDYEQTLNWDKNSLKEADVFGEGRTWWEWLQERDWLWAQFPAVDGAVGGVQRLRQRGHFVEALTSKPAWAEWTVWSWLGKWRIPFNRVTIVPSGTRKCDVSGSEILVDDYNVNCTSWAEVGRTAIMFTRPWNKDIHARAGVSASCAVPIAGSFHSGGRIYRANNWTQVLDVVRSLEEVKVAS